VSKNRLVGCDHLIQEFLKEQSEQDKDEPQVEPHTKVADETENNYRNMHQYGNEEIKQEPKELSYSSFENLDEEVNLETSDSTCGLRVHDKNPVVADEADNDDRPVQQFHQLKQSEFSVKQEPVTHFDDPYLSNETHAKLIDPRPSHADPIDPILGVPSVNVTVLVGNDEMQTNLSEYSCSLNDIKTPYQSNTYQHKSVHSSDQSDGSVIHANNLHHKEPRQSMSREKPHTCPHCNKQFKRKNYLHNHVKHLHLKEKIFSCDICDYTSSKKGHVKRHMLTHTGVKAYRCEYCDLRFGRSDELARHTRNHCKKLPNG